MITLTKKETETLVILIRLGDSKELAIKTIINNRVNQEIQESSKEFYTFGYLN